MGGATTYSGQFVLQINKIFSKNGGGGGGGGGESPWTPTGSEQEHAQSDCQAGSDRGKYSYHSVISVHMYIIFI